MYHGDLTDKLKALYKLHLPPGEGLLTSQGLSRMGWRPCCVAYSRSCSPWALCTVPELPRVTSTHRRRRMTGSKFSGQTP